MRAYRDLQASTIIVNLKTEKAFRGILWSMNKERLLVLRNAELLQHGAETPVDGEVVIDVANIDFIQVVS